MVRVMATQSKAARKLSSHACARVLVGEGETTIKVKFALFRGVGRGGREENCPKMLFFWGGGCSLVARLYSRNFVDLRLLQCVCFFVGIATTIKF